jgi:hypothetical protein
MAAERDPDQAGEAQRGDEPAAMGYFRERAGSAGARPRSRRSARPAARTEASASSASWTFLKESLRRRCSARPALTMPSSSSRRPGVSATCWSSRAPLRLHELAPEPESVLPAEISEGRVGGRELAPPVTPSRPRLRDLALQALTPKLLAERAEASQLGLELLRRTRSEPLVRALEARSAS